MSATHPEARDRNTQHMEFLWVRWIDIEPKHRYGPRYPHLPMVGFIEDTDELAFGFLNPSLVIRGCHPIPRFHSGRTNTLMAYDCQTSGSTDDWTNYYVNTFVLSLILSPSFHLTRLVPYF